MREHTDDPDVETISKVDHILHAALLDMVNEGVTVRFALSRLLTFTALHYVVNESADVATSVFREAADNIEAGRFRHREGEKHQPN